MTCSYSGLHSMSSSFSALGMSKTLVTRFPANIKGMSAFFLPIRANMFLENSRIKYYYDQKHLPCHPCLDVQLMNPSCFLLIQLYFQVPASISWSSHLYVSPILVYAVPQNKMFCFHFLVKKLFTLHAEMCWFFFFLNMPSYFLWHSRA